MPAISPLVPSRLILNLSPAEGGRGVTTRWQPGRLRVIRFNCNLSANWSDYPRTRLSQTRTKAAGHRPSLPHHLVVLSPMMSMPSCLFRNQRTNKPPKTIGSKTARASTGTQGCSPGARLPARRYLCRRRRLAVCTGFLKQRRAPTCIAIGARA